MRKEKGQLYAIFAAVAAVALLAILISSVFGMMPFSHGGPTANVIATANVQRTCFISLSPATTQFGQVDPASSTDTNFAVTDNNAFGNTNANILLAGSNWVVSLLSFPVSNTLWNPTSLSSYSGNSLNLYVGGGNFVNTNVIALAASTNTIYFGLSVPAGQPPGNYAENIVFENQC